MLPQTTNKVFSKVLKDNRLSSTRAALDLRPISKARTVYRLYSWVCWIYLEVKDTYQTFFPRAAWDIRWSVLKDNCNTNIDNWYRQLIPNSASKIRDAYAFIAQNFEEGDEISIFGRVQIKGWLLQSLLSFLAGFHGRTMSINLETTSLPFKCYIQGRLHCQEASGSNRQHPSLKDFYYIECLMCLAGSDRSS